MTRRLFLLATALLLHGACAGGALPETHYYVLRGKAGIERASASVGLAVGVRSFAVDPPYDQDRLVYRRGTDAVEVGFYAYHRWASPLGRQIALAFADGLQGTPGVGSIEPARPAIDYTARLDGRVLFLEEIDSAAGEQVRLGLDLTLRNKSGEVLWSEVVHATAGGAAGDVGAVADMAQKALDDAVARVRASLAIALRE